MDQQTLSRVCRGDGVVPEAEKAEPLKAGTATQDRWVSAPRQLRRPQTLEGAEGKH